MKDKQLTNLFILIAVLAVFALFLILGPNGLNFDSGLVLNKLTNNKVTAPTYPGKLKLTSTRFENEGVIPIEYTCKGKDINPPLTIKDTPIEAKSLVLIVEDPDALYKTWTHWSVFNMDPKQTEIPQNSLPWGATLGQNDFGSDDYKGPCPPVGKHHYTFKLYALDTVLELDSGSTKKQLDVAMNGHILDLAQLIGVFEK